MSSIIQKHFANYLFGGNFNNRHIFLVKYCSNILKSFDFIIKLVEFLFEF